MEKDEKIKIIFPFRSCPMRNRKFQKITKKFKKIKIYHCGFISSQNRQEKAAKERIKIILPFHSYPRRDRKFQKKGKKIQKIKIVIENSIKIVKKSKKTPLWLHFKSK